MNNSEKSGSKLFPVHRGRPTFNVSSIDVSVELFLKAGLFAILRDDGVYANKIQSEMTETLENMKTMLEDTPSTNNNLAAQSLADAYARARSFVLSTESRDYLSIFSNEDFEKVSKKILDEVYKCLSMAAQLMGEEEDFGMYLSNSEALVSSHQRIDTIPYGVRKNDDSAQPAASAPYVSYAPKSNFSKHFIRSTSQDFPTINLAEEARKAGLVKDILTADKNVPVSAPPTSLNPLPPPPISGPKTGSKMEALDKSTEAKKYFKKRFLDVYKSEFLKKLRDIASAKSDAEGINKDGKFFDEAFDYICRKTYLQITSDVTGGVAVLDLHNLVEQKVADGTEWKSVIRNLGEDAIASEAQEVMRIYVPIITGAYLSHDKYRETILNIQNGNDEEIRAKLDDAANCILDYIRENMFKALTSSRIDAVVYLGYFFRETRSDLELIFYEELYAAAGDMFAKIQHKDMVETESITSVAEEEMPITLRGTGINPMLCTVQTAEELKPYEYLNPLSAEKDDEDDPDLFILGNTRKVFPKVTPAAEKPARIPSTRETPNAPVISYKADDQSVTPRTKKPVQIVNTNTPATPLPDSVPLKKKDGLWNGFRNSKAGKVATGAAFAVATVMAGYGSGVFSNSEKQDSTDTTHAAASKRVSTPAGSGGYVQSADVSFNNITDLSKTAPKQNADKSNVYAIHLEKIAGDDIRLKNLVEKESFEREPGIRGDFEQLHSIVGQGALTAAQQNKLHDDLNGKYNRGEYGAATKRFRPLLDNGEIFKVLGNANHPEHSALKAAVGKFGSPSTWSWSRKKPVMENGKVQVKSMPYETLHGEDVEFFEQCRKDFKAVGIGKNGNVHLRNGEAGERIPLKINGKWITFVETALQIRGIIEARGAQDIPVPPSSIMNDAVTPADTIPTNIAPVDSTPVDMEIDLQPKGHGKEGYLHLNTPSIEMSEPVMMAMSDLEDDPEIEMGEMVEVDLRDLEDDPEIEVGETEMDDETLLAIVDDGWDSEDTDSPSIEVRETKMDDETLLAIVDDGWDSEEIAKSIEKTLQKVKLAA